MDNDERRIWLNGRNGRENREIVMGTNHYQKVNERVQIKNN